MNIFYLDDDLPTCAKYYFDTHVIKMILESTQILCTVLHESGMDAPYRSTHRHHPCVLWAKESLENWLWLQELVVALNEEYQYRFEHDEPHKSFLVSRDLLLPGIPSLGLTEHPQVMPDCYKIPGSPVLAYRQFYATEKRHLLKYTKRRVPNWCLAHLRDV